MAIDLDRVATTAIETTLNGGRRRRRGRPVARTLAAGAALYAAVRVGQKGAPTRPLKLMKVGTKTLGEFRELSDVVRNRLFERGEDYEEPADGEDEDGWEDEPDDDEPRGEGDDWAEGEDEEPDEDEDEGDCCRRAGEDDLQAVDWTIGYLHGIRKTEISKALAENRSFIRRRLMRQPDEGMPIQQTDET